MSWRNEYTAQRSEEFLKYWWWSSGVLLFDTGVEYTDVLGMKKIRWAGIKFSQLGVKTGVNMFKLIKITKLSSNGT